MRPPLFGTPRYLLAKLSRLFQLSQSLALTTLFKLTVSFLYLPEMAPCILAVCIGALQETRGAACSWSVHQVYVHLVLSSSRCVWMHSAKWGENLPSWLAIPTRRRSSVSFLGTYFIEEIMDVFSMSAWMPLPLIRWPRNLPVFCGMHTFLD